MTSRLNLFVPSSVLLGGVLLISGIREQYTVKAPKAMTAIPAVFENVQGSDQIIDDEERKVAGMTDYSLRTFGPDSAQLFSIYVGYYDRQVQGKAIHSPKNCLPGAGWDILSSARIPAPSGAAGATVNRVLLGNKGTRALVYYWYQGRGHTESSEYVVKWNLLRDAAVYGRTEEALVRIVVPVARAKAGQVPTENDADVRAADTVARSVAMKLEPAVSQVLPAAPSM